MQYREPDLRKHGGHGLVQSSSIVTLLPECVDDLARGGFGHIPLIATGGIMDGRGVAAALALGASGVCMGTRFLASPEAVISNGYRNAIVQARDGGVTTASAYDGLAEPSKLYADNYTEAREHVVHS